MSVQIVRNVGPAGIDVAYERFGEAGAPPVLLIMGVGTQMLGWPDAFCEVLAARGVHVIRFDNRDIGLSSHLTDARAPDLGAAFRGDTSSASYTLSDMAADTVGLLDGLDLDSAHVVGASMGGMIAQTLAIEHPTRARSLTSIMSTTGNPAVGQPTQAALAALLSPPAAGREQAIERTVKIVRVIGSPGFEIDEAELRFRTGLAYDRAYDPLGVARQLLAIAASGDRTTALRSVATPTLVIHGVEDPLVNVSGGQATAEAIPGAELVLFDGMGHDLPRTLWGEFTRLIAELVKRAEGRALTRP
ncbi:MAG TPA: alpha/beta hydrolase [Solirubrobacteraceae bacterium]|nr:alpha/beta hydrolase [Solirubrobacteraceae bacterium]